MVDTNSNVKTDINVYVCHPNIGISKNLGAVYVAFEVVETIAVLHFGRLVAEGSKEAVRADPAVQEIYLGTEAAGGSGRSR